MKPPFCYLLKSGSLTIEINILI